MAIRVIVPPGPIVTPADIPGDHEPDDAAVKARIAAVTHAIDGPAGLVGRSFGPQTLELAAPAFRRMMRLTFGPIIKIDQVSFLDGSDAEQIVDPAAYRLAENYAYFGEGLPSRTACAPDAVRIRYRAGYDGVAVSDGGTGEVPANVKLAIIMEVQYLQSVLATEDFFVRSEEVEGVGVTTYTVSEAAERVISARRGALLQNLMVPAL